jgi:ribosomal protein S18 acetylase RimI-like enzyme
MPEKEPKTVEAAKRVKNIGLSAADIPMVTAISNPSFLPPMGVYIDEDWPEDHPNEKVTNPEKFTIRLVRGIIETEDPTENYDYGRIALWMSDVEARRHLRVPIPPIKNIADKKATEEALRGLDRHYHNKNKKDKDGNAIYGDPQEITPIMAVNGLGEAVGSLIIRWIGEPFEYHAKVNNRKIIENLDRVAFIESLIVDPSLQDSSFGTQLMMAALEIAFKYYNGYGGKSAIAARVWMYFADYQSGNFSRNFIFFRKFGFENVGTAKGGTWKERAEIMHIPNPDKRDGEELALGKRKWQKMKRKDAIKEHPKLIFSPSVIDKASLRIPHEI